MINYTNYFAKRYEKENLHVYTNKDEGYEMFDEREFTIEIENPFDIEKNIYLMLRKNKILLIYSGWSIQKGCDERGIQEIQYLMDIILENHAYILWVEWKDNLLNALINEHLVVFSDRAKVEIRRFFNNAEFLRAIADKNAHIKRIYWVENEEIPSTDDGYGLR